MGPNAGPQAVARTGSGLSQQFGGRAALGPSRWDLGGRAAAPGGRVRVFCLWVGYLKALEAFER